MSRVFLTGYESSQHYKELKELFHANEIAVSESGGAQNIDEIISKVKNSKAVITIPPNNPLANDVYGQYNVVALTTAKLFHIPRFSLQLSYKDEVPVSQYKKGLISSILTSYRDTIDAIKELV